MGQHFSPKDPAAGLVQLPDVYRLLLKEEAMLHRGKHCPELFLITLWPQVQFKFPLFTTYDAGFLLNH